MESQFSKVNQILIIRLPLELCQYASQLLKNCACKTTPATYSPRFDISSLEEYAHNYSIIDLMTVEHTCSVLEPFFSSGLL